MRKPPARTIWLSDYQKELVRMNPLAEGKVDWNLAENLRRQGHEARAAAGIAVSTNHLHGART